MSDGASGQRGDVAIEIAPETTDDPVMAARFDDLVHRVCSLARSLTGAEQAALKVDLAGDGRAARKFFNLSERYDSYRVQPRRTLKGEEVPAERALPTGRAVPGGCDWLP